MTLRSTRALLSLAVIFLASACLHAQTSVYGAVSDANYCAGRANNNYSCKDNVVGFSAGAVKQFVTASRFKAGIDLRFDGSPGYKGGEAGLAAFRLAFEPRTHSVSTYIQVGGGYETTTYPSTVCIIGGFGSTCYTNQIRRSGGVAEFAVGINVRAGHHLFLRPVELMSSAGSSVGHVSVGTAIGYTF